MNEMKITKSQIVKLYVNLSEYKTVIGWRSKEERIPYYSLHHRFFDISESCLDCKFCKREKRLGIKFIGCKINGKDCVHDFARSRYNNLQVMKKSSEEVDVDKIERKQAKVTHEDKNIDEWKTLDFIEFYKKESREYLPEMILDNNHNIRQYMIGVVQNFKERFDNNWRRMLRLYIRKRLELAKREGKFVTSSGLSNAIAIGKFISKNSSKANIEFCDEKNIYCSYMRKKCQVIKNGLECTKVIRNKMRKLYN